MQTGELDFILMLLVRSTDRKRKGNRDGMTVSKHKLIPSYTPLDAVLLSKIKRSIADIVNKPVAFACLAFISNTS